MTGDQRLFRQNITKRTNRELLGRSFRRMVEVGVIAPIPRTYFPGLQAGYPRTGSLERRKCGEGAAGPASRRVFGQGCCLMHDSLRVRALAQTST